MKTGIVIVFCLLCLSAIAQNNILGCTDSIACNYNPQANITDAFQCNYDCYGCMDSTACNFDPYATLSDGYCYNNDLGCGCDQPAPQFGYDCFGNCLDENFDGECDLIEIYGCDDSLAINYNPSATINDGSCEQYIEGCTDPDALNFSIDANLDDNSCLYYGCTDSLALNFSSTATLSDNSCIYENDNACNGRYLNKIFDEVEITTLTYSEEFSQKLDIYQAINDSVQEERPLIIYVHGGGFIDGQASHKSNYHSTVIANEFAKRGYVVASINYRQMETAELICGGLCGELLIPSDFTNYLHEHIAQAYMDAKSAVRFMRKTIAEGNPFRINGEQIYMGGHSAGGIITNHLFFEQENEIGYNHLLNDDISENGGFLGNSGNNGFSSEITGAFNLSGALFYLDVINQQDLDKLYISVHGTSDPIVPYESGNLYLGSLWNFPFYSNITPNMYGSKSIDDYMTSLGGTNHYHLSIINGGHNFEPSLSWWGNGAEELMISFVSELIYTNLPCSENEVIGCTDSSFINYNTLANLNNQNCSDSVILGCTDQTASNFNINSNTDDGSCLNISGCTDSLAFNYQPNASVDNESCEEIILGCTQENYIEFISSANTDDGSCITEIIYGCLDSAFYNFNEFANTDDNSCIPFIFGCTDVFASNFDFEANTNDGSCVVFGCMDSLALNFNSLANHNDYSCYYFQDCNDTSYFDTTACNSFLWENNEFMTSGVYYSDLLYQVGQSFEGTSIDSYGTNVIILGNSYDEDGLGSVKVLEYNGIEWQQKGQKIYGSYLDLDELQDNFGVAVSIGNENTIAASSVVSDDSYETCGDWELLLEWQCPAPPFWCPGWVSYPHIPCWDIPITNKGVVKVYEWLNNEWSQKGESIWGQFEYDGSGENVIMPDANTLAITSSKSGLTENGANGHVRVFQWLNNQWVLKGSPIYGSLFGDNLGRLVEMPNKNTLFLSNDSQNKIVKYQWDGFNWISYQNEFLLNSTIKDFSVYEENVMSVSLNESIRVYDLFENNWIQRGSEILCNQCSLELGDSNTLTISDNTIISIYRWYENEWIKITDKSHNNNNVIMPNPNFVITNSAVFKYSSLINQFGCDSISVLDLEINPINISGCIDSLACNYDSLLTCDDGSCEFPDQYYNCEGECINDSDQDGICDENEIFGCTDPNGYNYNSLATENDSCIYLTNALSLKGILDIGGGLGSSNGRAIHLIANEDITDLSLFGIGVANDGNGSDGEEETLPSMSVSIGDNILLARSIESMEAYFGDCLLEFEHILMASSLINHSGDDAIELFESGILIESFGNPNIDGSDQYWEYTDSWAYNNGDGSFVFGGVNCTDGSSTTYMSSCPYPICPIILGCTNENYLQYNAYANIDDGSCLTLIVEGCLDHQACNYDSLSNVSNESCVYEIYSIIDTTVCGIFEWKNQIYNQSSIITDTFNLNQNNTYNVFCDSIEIINLTVNQSSYSIDSQIYCDEYVWIDNNTYTQSNNSATYTLTNNLGCDSVITLDLSINYSETYFDTITSCDSYTWVDGIMYTESGDYTHINTNIFVCDSTHNLNLTINNSSLTEQFITACDSYNWIDGNVYSQSGEYMFVSTNEFGCPDTNILTLVVNEITSSNDTLVVCDEYEWNNQILSYSGEYVFNTLNSVNCDSIANLNLIIADHSILEINGSLVGFTETIDNIYNIENPITGSTYHWSLEEGFGTIFSTIDDNFQVSINWDSPHESFSWINQNVSLCVYEEDEFGCVGEESCIDIELITLSKIDNHELITLNIFPNPFENETTVKFTNSKSFNVSIKLIDMRGKTVRNYEGITENSVIIKKEELSEGMYYILLNLNNNIFRKPIVIQ